MEQQYSINDVVKFIVAQTGCGEAEVEPNVDLLNDLGCSGDDFDDLIEAYAKEFHIDISAYLWYFHTDEEGNNIGGMFFKPPYERVKHIPVTPDLLLKYANVGKWEMIYPDHVLPKRRYDIIINSILVIGTISVLIYFLIRKVMGA